MTDLIESKSNGKKSRNGRKLEVKIEDTLNSYSKEKKIKSFVVQPKYSHPTTSKKQFRPDFEIELNNGDILILDSTTTARSDRIKGKQWDARGIKEHFSDKGITPTFWVVVPNLDEIGSPSKRKKEISCFNSVKNNISDTEYFSSIDNIVTISDLISKLDEI